MNRLLVPHVGDEHLGDVLAALSGAETLGWRVCVEEVDPTDNQAYWRLLDRYWRCCAAGRWDLCVVEHDVVVHPDTLDAFAECPNRACAFPYWLGGSHGVGLGCTRFRSALIAEDPSLVFDAGLLTDDGLREEGHWKRLDTRVWRLAGPACIHEPPVKHLHRYAMEEPA